MIDTAWKEELFMASAFEPFSGGFVMKLSSSTQHVNSSKLRKDRHFAKPIGLEPFVLQMVKHRPSCSSLENF